MSYFRYLEGDTAVLGKLLIGERPHLRLLASTNVVQATAKTEKILPHLQRAPSRFKFPPCCAVSNPD